MEIKKKFYLMPLSIFVLSFIVEFLAGKLSFFTKTLAFWLFWLSLSIAGLLVFLTIFSLVQKFIHEHISTPLKKVQNHKEKIKNEQSRITELLNFNTKDQPLYKLQDHFNKLKNRNFSEEALTHYLGRWYDHIHNVQSQLQILEGRQRLEDFEEEKEGLLIEIEELQKQKKELQQNELENNQNEKEEFFKENEDELFFYTEDLNPQEEQWLLEKGYEKTHQWDIEQKGTKEIMVKTRSNEGASHAYLTGALCKYLRSELAHDDVKIYETKYPDVVFSVNGFEWAIEIETGSMMKKNPKELKQKVATNNKKYSGTWFFLVTNKNLVSKYKTLGDTVDRSNVIDKIEGIIYPEGRMEIDLK